MRKNYCLLIYLFALTAMGWPGAVHAKLSVVITTPDLADLAKAVGDNRVTVTTLAKPTEDPHFVDAKPSFVVKLNRADALIEGGADLEIGWLPALLDGTRNPKIAAGAPGRIAGSQNIPLLEVPATLDRSKGDLHAMGNPHYLTDPMNAKMVVQTIAAGFSRLDPAGAGTYRSKADQVCATLDAKLAEWQKLLAPFQGQQVVAYHNTWPYFAQRFGLKIDLFLEPKPGIPPTPAHLAEVITKMKTEGIRVIIVEPYQNRRTAEKVAADTGATVVDFTQYPGGVKGSAGGYIEMMDYLVRTLAKALGAKS